MELEVGPAKPRWCSWVIRQLFRRLCRSKLMSRMGGLLIADAALDIARNTREGDPMWPKVVAICGTSLIY